MTITAITIGCTAVEHKPETQFVYDLAAEIMQLAKEAVEDKAKREVVVRMLKAMAMRDTGIQIYNGDRILMHTNCDVNRAIFMMTFPGDEPTVYWEY